MLNVVRLKVLKEVGYRGSLSAAAAPKRGHALLKLLFGDLAVGDVQVLRDTVEETLLTLIGDLGADPNFFAARHHVEHLVRVAKGAAHAPATATAPEATTAEATSTTSRPLRILSVSWHGADQQDAKTQQD